MRTTIAVLILGAMSASAGEDWHQRWLEERREIQRENEAAVQRQNDRLMDQIERQRQQWEIQRQQQRIIKALEEE